MIHPWSSERTSPRMKQSRSKVERGHLKRDMEVVEVQCANVPISLCECWDEYWYRSWKAIPCPRISQASLFSPYLAYATQKDTTKSIKNCSAFNWLGRYRGILSKCRCSRLIILALNFLSPKFALTLTQL